MLSRLEGKIHDTFNKMLSDLETKPNPPLIFSPGLVQLGASQQALVKEVADEIMRSLSSMTSKMKI